MVEVRAWQLCVWVPKPELPPSGCRMHSQHYKMPSSALQAWLTARYAGRHTVSGSCGIGHARHASAFPLLES